MLKKYKSLILDTLSVMLFSAVIAWFFISYYLYYTLGVMILLLLYYIILLLCENQLLFVPGVGRKDKTLTPFVLYARNFFITLFAVGTPYLLITLLRK